MKKIILINLLAIVANCLTAQPAQKTGIYYTANLDAYVGIWEYSDDTCTFRIYLKKGKSYSYDVETLTKRYSNEEIFGGHYIKRNGVVIINLEAATRKATAYNNTMTISASNSQEAAEMVNPNVLMLAFYDDLKDKSGTGELTLIQGNPAQLHWQITETDIRYSMKGVPELVMPGWTVPEDVILTKISVF